MALADRVAAGPDRSLKGPACGIGRILSDLPAEEADALRCMLTDPSWTTTAIREALDEEGFAIGRHPLQRHRAGECSCEQRGLR